MSELVIMQDLLNIASVDWKPLEEVGTFLRGKRFVKSDLIPDGVPCIHYGEMYTHYGIWSESARSFLSKGVASQLRTANHGDVIIVAAGETIEDIGNGTAWLGENDVVFHDACFSFKSEQNPKYVSYYLRTKLFKEQIKKHISSGKISSINAKGLGKAKIPIPYPENPKKSLEIQAEIVRILDTFTSLTTELSARKRQFKYYRDELLSFKNSEVEWKPLGEIGDFIRGKRFTKADYVDEGIDVIHYGEIYTDYGVSTTNARSQVRAEMAASLRYAEPNDVVITDVGETVEDVGKAVAWLGNDKVAIHDHCYAFRHSMNPKFVAYCMQTTSFIADKAKYVVRAKVKTLLINGFSKVCIPVPPPEEQERIVVILDKFDTLTSSISEGLPREIKLRQQQYEYYRDLLLNFPKPVATEVQYEQEDHQHNHKESPCLT
ncbi:restriction endonuclease subunit S [Endozoicomonas acroporae]|uniref:restriction endonuclease subunit S n=1 Tax=Endozoicomonas acroporae TaxID=1701104 RepID=UPI000C78FA76|nr:restriction endonuclease subunit S [Endozoicomonas acroporae]